jgi:hypothetical protein
MRRTTRIGECECNYGVHPLVSVCRELDIPFDTGWEAGGDYSAGEGHARWYEDGVLSEAEWSLDASDHEFQRLVALHLAGKTDEAMARLKEVASRPFFKHAPPLSQIPPKPSHVDQLIALLCPDMAEGAIRENLESAA